MKSSAHLDVDDRFDVRPNGKPEGTERRWVLDLGGQQLRLLESDAALIKMITQLRLTPATKVYELGSDARTLADIPQLRSLFEEPLAVAGSAHTDSSALALDELNVELAVLDRPLEGEADYYDEVPRPRWPRRAATAAILLLAGGGYMLSPLRHAPIPGVPTPPLIAPPAQATDKTTPARPPSSTVAEARAVPLEAPPSPMPAPITHPVAPPATPAKTPSAHGQRAATPDVTDRRGSRHRSLASNDVAHNSGGRSVGPAKDHSQLMAEANRLLERGRNREAQALFGRILVDKRDDPAALTGLAYVFLDRGQFRKAMALFQRAMAHERNYGPALFGLGESYWQQGMQSAAVDAFNRYLTIQPSGSEADMARRLIRNLTSGNPAG